MAEDTALVTALITERPLCLPCLAEKSGLPGARLRETLGRVGRVLSLHDAVGRCRSCGTTTDVVSIDRPAE